MVDLNLSPLQLQDLFEYGDSLDNLAPILNLSGQNYNIDDHSIFKFKVHFSLCKSLLFLRRKIK